ncbi:MAG: biopolymer transporter ExbD [Thermogutta sp.]|nr:biopolymer transporter ExbD [Thermogutta sp.]
MRAPSVAGRPSVRMNMTPMIDVTFQLILFFILAGHLAQQESPVDVRLPSAATGEKAKESETRRIVINVTPDSQILVGGRAVDEIGLRRVLEAEAARHDDLEVRIRTDRRAPYAAVAPVLVCCAKAGIWNVAFSVVEEK